MYQSQQLNQQKNQFLEQFKKLREEGRRNALLLARDILSSSENRALAMNDELNSISDFVPLYIQSNDLTTIIDSNNIDDVYSSILIWYRRIGPCIELMKGIKSAAQVYFVPIDKKDIDFR